MIFRTFFEGPRRHLSRLVKSQKYRQWNLLNAKLANIPRFVETDINVDGWQLKVPDVASFLSAYNEIFINEIYDFKAFSHPPRILDLGANIGLSVLFFKKHFPESSVTAFEADPRIFEYLQHNVYGNNYRDVTLINQAAWNEETTLKFFSEGADGGRVSAVDEGDMIAVRAIDIRSHLAENQYDFLKMDIEGAEEVVLPACAGYLKSFRYIFVEYHSRVGQQQCLPELLSLLKDAGFRLNIQPVFHSSKPFVQLQESSGFDLQLNIFAVKESGE